MGLIWPVVLPTLEGVCKRHPYYHSPESLYQSFVDGRSQLWVVVDDDKEEKLRAVFATQIYRTDVDCQVCSIVLCASSNGSKSTEWVDLISEVEEWGRSQGCERMRLEARRGWVKPLRERGYAPAHTIVEKELG